MATRACSRLAARQVGVVLLAVLIFILVTTLAASSLVVAHTTQVQRDKEEQLLFVGDQYRRAIASYYSTVPSGSARSLPPSLEVLLSDPRFATPIQHLRRLYPDPMTGRADWTLVMENGGVVGIRSQSGKAPIKRQGFVRGYEQFEGKQLYSDWVFSLR